MSGVAEQEARESWCGVKSTFHRFTIYLTYQSSCIAQLCKADKGIDQGDEAARLLAMMGKPVHVARRQERRRGGGGVTLGCRLPRVVSNSCTWASISGILFMFSSGGPKLGTFVVRGICK